MERMKGYKGFNDKLQCTPEGKVFQYEVGKTYTHNGTVLMCSSGFHFTEHPLDALSYYNLGNASRYAEIEADEVSDKTEKDSKRVAKSLTIKAEIKAPALIKAAVKFVFEKCSPTTGDSAHSATTGDHAHSATTGGSAHSATTGYSAHSATTGYYAHSATTGDSAHSATTGDYAHSAVKGKEAIAIAVGCQSRAKGAKGCWLVLAEWKDRKIIAMGVARVNGIKIKADTFYALKNGKFTEVPA